MRAWVSVLCVLLVVGWILYMTVRHRTHEEPGLWMKEAAPINEEKKDLFNECV